MLKSQSRIVRGTTAGFVRLARHQTAHCPIWRIRSRWQSTGAAVAAVVEETRPEPKPSLAIPSKARVNEIGVQQLSEYMFRQVFPNGAKKPPAELVELAKDHLRRHDLLGKNTDNSPPIAFDLPGLQGDTLDEHFYRLGSACAEPYLTKAREFARADLPPRPPTWKVQSGWTRYPSAVRLKSGEEVPEVVPWEKVDVPLEDALCFDVEVMWKESPYAVMACAASAEAWYMWISPWLLGEVEDDRQLVPLGDPTRARIVVGHNIGFDRARIREEYSLAQSGNAFVDTMSLHVAVNGMCSQQRPTWMKHKKNRELKERIASSDNKDVALAELLKSSSASGSNDEDEMWVEKSSINSLRDVAKLHLNVAIDKSVRDDFGQLDRRGVVAKIGELLDYCAADVAVTHKVYKIVFPSFLDRCPHPVSFAALRHLSSVILPVDRSWDSYIRNAEATYHRLSEGVRERLIGLARKALEVKDDPAAWGADPWLSQLDWTGQEIRMVKPKKKGEPARPAARQKMPGKPRWYKDLFPQKNGSINLTVRTRLAPVLFRLSWDGHPLVWSDKYGWTFRVPTEAAAPYLGANAVRCDLSDEPVEALRRDREAVYFKLPHKDGPAARCANPLAKGYLVYFENGTLSSEYPYAKEALEMNASCSYWISARERIRSQMVVYDRDLAGDGADPEPSLEPGKREQGYILPQVIPMGTVTRRAVENTWLTASNAKKNRVGSELKAMVKAPPGYSFVGADVDSEELWIASLVGDATFKLHGGNAIGFMTLEGTKAAGTDLHSRTAAILGITRNDAKVFNYGRVYGAGLKFAATLLRQFNPSMPEAQTIEVATKLYAATKGTKTNRKLLSPRPFWRGGTESFVFNKLEEFAEQERPRTPVLGAGITEALISRHISKGGYLTSRINWAIQSSGVDYLHLLIVSMDYLVRRFGIDARLAITVHDEIRYLVRDHDRYRAAMALQVSNLWTRAMFAQQVGIGDLPQACAYFSAIDIDHVLRKEVDLDCVTPSHPDFIPPGESLDILGLLDKGDQAALGPEPIFDDGNPDPLQAVAYEPRVPVMESLDSAGHDVDTVFLRAQTVSDDGDLRQLVKEKRKAITAEEKRFREEQAMLDDGDGDGDGDGVHGSDWPRGTFPYMSEPVLMPMEEPLSVGAAMRRSTNMRAGGALEWARKPREGGVWNTDI